MRTSNVALPEFSVAGPEVPGISSVLSLDALVVYFGGSDGDLLRHIRRFRLNCVFGKVGWAIAGGGGGGGDKGDVGDDELEFAVVGYEVESEVG
jgi:hypothetical protein